MARHTNHPDGSACESCEEKLKTAHPDIADWFRTCVKPSFNDAHIAWAYRGKEDQNKAFSEGMSKLEFPKSKHNYTVDNVPMSKAIDLFQLDELNLAKWPYKFYKQISEKMPASINWGGNWKSFKDYPHFELIT